MADPFTPERFQTLRAALARLTALSHRAVPAPDAIRLRAAGAAAEALRLLLLDPTLAALLTTDADDPAALEQAAPAPDPVASSPDVIPHPTLPPPHSEDPDWDTLAPGPQTAAQRNDIFALFLRLDWPVPRITNALAKHAGITAPTAPTAVDAIATLDGRATHALLGYLAGHWQKAQEGAR